MESPCGPSSPVRLLPFTTQTRKPSLGEGEGLTGPQDPAGPSLPVRTTDPGPPLLGPHLRSAVHGAAADARKLQSPALHLPRTCTEKGLGVECVPASTSPTWTLHVPRPVSSPGQSLCLGPAARAPSGAGSRSLLRAPCLRHRDHRNWSEASFATVQAWQGRGPGGLRERFFPSPRQLPEAARPPAPLCPSSSPPSLPLTLLPPSPAQMNLVMTRGQRGHLE